ncbi:MAG: hypothetical protein CL910_08290 [Deltaproteobacteria bacterium]|nr:hypothetical protein [Deltaproteobacteria bacterium]
MAKAERVQDKAQGGIEKSQATAARIEKDLAKFKKDLATTKQQLAQAKAKRASKSTVGKLAKRVKLIERKIRGAEKALERARLGGSAAARGKARAGQHAERAAAGKREREDLPGFALVASFQMKKVRQKGEFRIDLNKYTSDSLSMRFDSNIGDLRRHLDATRLERLHFASLLHDIGMLKIPPERHQDARAFQNHPLLGAHMLARIRLWEPLAPIVQCHHEWIDGSGYPEGRTGDSIPLEARVISVADAMDAMRRENATDPAKSLPEIVAELEAGRGTQFDSDVVSAAVALVDRGEIGF